MSYRDCRTNNSGVVLEAGKKGPLLWSLNTVLAAPAQGVVVDFFDDSFGSGAALCEFLAPKTRSLGDAIHSRIYNVQ